MATLSTRVMLLLGILIIFAIISIISTLNIDDISTFDIYQFGNNNRNRSTSIDKQDSCCFKQYLQWSHTGDWIGAGISHFTRSLTCALSDAYLTNRTFIFYLNKSTDHTYFGSHSNMSILGFYDMYNIDIIDTISITDFKSCPCYNKIISDIEIVGNRSLNDRMPQITWNSTSKYLYRIMPNKPGKRAWYHSCDSPLRLNNAIIKYVDIMAANRIWPPLNKDIYKTAALIHKKMNNATDFMCAHVRRGDKLRGRKHLNIDTKPENIFNRIRMLYPNTINNTNKLHLYIASNQYNLTFFNQLPLNKSFHVVNMHSFKDIVDTYLPPYHVDENILREAVLDSYICEKLSTYHVETFNDLTHECSDHVLVRRDKGRRYCQYGKHIWLHYRSGTWMFKQEINHKEHWWDFLQYNATFFEEFNNKSI